MSGTVTLTLTHAQAEKLLDAVGREHRLQACLDEDIVDVGRMLATALRGGVPSQQPADTPPMARPGVT